MDVDALENLNRLSANDNIAIAVLSTMLIVSLVANIVQFLSAIKDRKACEERETMLLINFREDMKHAWSYVAKLSEALKVAEKNLEVFRALCRPGNPGG